MKTCSTCKYWGTSPGHDAAPHLHACACPKNCAGHHVERVPNDGMLTEDDEGWGFVTGPEFGCVNHDENTTLTLDDLKEQVDAEWKKPEPPLCMGENTTWMIGDFEIRKRK